MAEDPSEVGELRRRVAALERRVAALNEEVRTRRVVVTDDHERERVVIGVESGVAEVRVRLHRQQADGTEAVLFAAPGGDGLPAGAGFQLWLDGDVLVELERWADGTPAG